MYTVFNVKENFSTIYKKHVPQSPRGNKCLSSWKKSQKKEPHDHSYPPHLFHVSLNRNTADSVIKREEKTEREVKKGGGAPRNSERGKGGGRDPVKTTAKNHRTLPIHYLYGLSSILSSMYSAVIQGCSINPVMTKRVKHSKETRRHMHGRLCWIIT